MVGRLGFTYLGGIPPLHHLLTPFLTSVSSLQPSQGSIGGLSGARQGAFHGDQVLWCTSIDLEVFCAFGWSLKLRPIAIAILILVQHFPQEF